MRAPSENAIIALARFSDDPHYVFLMEWLEGLAQDEIRDGMTIAADVPLRQCQGRGQMISHILERARNPREALRKQRESEKQAAADKTADPNKYA